MRRIAPVFAVLAAATLLGQGCGSPGGGEPAGQGEPGEGSLSQAPEAITTDEGSDYDYVRLPQSLVTRDFVDRTGFAQDEVRDDVYAFGYLPHVGSKKLTRAEARQVQTLDEDLLRHNRVDPKTLELVADPAAASAESLDVQPLSLQTPSQYHNYVALYQEMKNLQGQYPTYMGRYSAGEAWLNITCPDADHPKVSGTQTCRRQLWFMRISGTPSVSSDKPRMFLGANIHGDEVIGREMLLRLMDLLGQGQDSDQEITSMLTALRSNAEILLMPSINPDGYEKQKRADCWKSSGTSHTTCYTGADLNRNFPNKETGQSDSSSGRAPETAAIMDKLYKYEPETYGGTPVQWPHPFVLGANFHGGSTCANMMFDSCPNTGSPTTNCRNNYPDQGAIFDEDLEAKSLGREFANLSPVIHGSGSSGSFYQGLTYGYEWYYISGGLQDWSVVYPNRDSLHMTVELTATKWPSFSSSTEGVEVSWTNNKKALVTYLYRGLKGVHLEIVDQAGQPITGVTVDVSGRPITLGATNKGHRAAGRTMNPANRGYNSSQKQAYMGGTPTDTGSISVIVSKSGYTTQTISVTPSDFDGTYTRVTLK